MGRNILIELVLFSLPFIVFGIYRLAVQDAETDGRKAWPIHILFGIGAVLAIGGILVFMALQDRERGWCYTEKQFVDGKVVEPTRYRCDQEIENIGIPASEDPGGKASGVGRKPAPAGVEPATDPDDDTRG